MDWLERRVFYDYIDESKLCVRYIEDTFVIWQHGKEKLMEFFKLACLDILTPCIKFTYELESNNSLKLLDVLVTRDQNSVYIGVYCKSIHTGQYIHNLSDHPVHTERVVFGTLK